MLMTCIFRLLLLKNRGMGGGIKRIRQLLRVPEYSSVQFLNSHKLVTTKLLLEESEKGL